jgi:hypothetical protein
MAFLGRVEATVTELAMRSQAPADPRQLLPWCARRMSSTRASYTRLASHLLRIKESPEALLRRPGASSNELLWTLFDWTTGDLPLDAALCERLWTRAFSSQSSAGHLHPLTPDTLLDAFVYDELTALHAAYRSAVALRDPQKIEQCRRIVEYHVANTQPDHTTAEPWALAAFAALDDTHTFAEQQLHDATTAATKQESPVILALLADAVLTLREAHALEQ